MIFNFGLKEKDYQRLVKVSDKLLNKKNLSSKKENFLGYIAKILNDYEEINYPYPSEF